MSSPAVLLIGGPETGKSNFLFRAWTHIFSGDGLVEKDGMPPDAEYLQDGAECQLRGEYAGHTQNQVQKMSCIPIVQKGNLHNKALLVVPDIDGEQINRIYRDRKWSGDWESLISDTTAYLFFIRVNSPQTVAPLDWIACHKLYGGLCEGQDSVPSPTESTGPGETDSPVKETKAETPTQVILVDWLQFVLDAVHSKYLSSVRPKVGVVVSGWDCVATDFEGGPSEWVKENMPLFHQFCATNTKFFDFSFFGSSVFSGDPESDSEFAEELTRKDPRTMGYIVYSTSNQQSADFTIPIAWALGWEPVT